MKFEELEPHWLHDCKQIDFTCNSCNLGAKRDAIQDHYICFARSMEEKAEDKKLITTLSNENEMLKTNYGKLLKDYIELNQKLQTVKTNQQQQAT